MRNVNKWKKYVHIKVLFVSHIVHKHQTIVGGIYQTTKPPTSNLSSSMTADLKKVPAIAEQEQSATKQN